MLYPHRVFVKPYIFFNFIQFAIRLWRILGGRGEEKGAGEKESPQPPTLFRERSERHFQNQEFLIK